MLASNQGSAVLTVIPVGNPFQGSVERKQQGQEAVQRSFNCSTSATVFLNKHNYQAPAKKNAGKEA